jgi:hypothetical protein
MVRLTVMFYFPSCNLAFNGRSQGAITFGGVSEPFAMTAVRLVLRIAILLTAGLSPAISWAADPVPRSVLILDQSDADSVWHIEFSTAFRSTLRAASSAESVSVYAEHVDLSRFTGARHDEVLRSYLRDKFRERPIGVLVVQGPATLVFVMGSRSELWPAVPVVFSGVDEETAARLTLPSDVTGHLYHLPFRNMVTAAQALVPNLKRIALVGDSWGTRTRSNMRHALLAVILVGAALLLASDRRWVTSAGAFSRKRARHRSG